MEITENVEEYLETLYTLDEEGKHVAKISDIASNLSVTPPSAVEMLKKIEKEGLVDYRVREGVSLTKKGRKLARRIIRNHRIAELLLTEILEVDIDDGTHEDMVCAIEHHITDEMADAVCTKLNHPGKCPHGKNIPEGGCCPS
jgi:DtxR family Mn-dependent transcriptional regulator